MKRFNLVICIAMLTILAGCSKDDDEGPVPTPPVPEVGGNAEKPVELRLSAEFGVYASPIVLTVDKQSPDNVIHYTTDGSVATIDSPVFPEAGIMVESSKLKSKYVLTPNVVSYNGWYNYGYIDKGLCISLMEVAPDGAVVAQKRGTFVINSDLKSSDIPVVCLSAPATDWLGADYRGGLYNTNPDLGTELKYRGWLEFYDQKSNESFALNTQMKRGGNWTRSFPCRTINLNFNKDENGTKNPVPKLDIFDGHERMDGNGTVAGLVRRFRLHSGGNACFGTMISDAFVHRLVGRRTNVSTTAWRPCMLYLNAEYWGVYQLREHYSDIYFQNNYGVDKDEVMYVDKTYNGDNADAAYSRYRFEVKEGDAAEVLAALDELYAFLGYDYAKAPHTLARDWDTDGWELTGEGTKYAQFCQMVDVESLVDLVLIQGYCSNWDFMYNNLRMWRTRSVDPSNKYADGRWRFCLHDVDFVFEDATADNVFMADDGTTGDGLWNSHQISVFDYYTGNAKLATGSVQGYLLPYNYLILYLPMQNPEFKALVKRRAEYIQRLFDVSDCEALLSGMVSEMSPYINDRAERWGTWWNYDSWQGDINYRLWRIQNRAAYFMPQVVKAFGLAGL